MSGSLKHTSWMGLMTPAACNVFMIEDDLVVSDISSPKRSSRKKFMADLEMVADGVGTVMVVLRASSGVGDG